MPKLLTAAAVDKLRPDAKRKEIRDGGAPGLRLVIQPSGHKSWVMRFRGAGGRHTKLTLGTVDLTRSEDAEPVLGGPLTLSAARVLANQVSRQRAQGVDVAEAKRQLGRRGTAANDFGALVRDFVEDHARPNLRGWRTTAKTLGLTYPDDGSEPTVIPRSLASRWSAKAAAEIDPSMIYAAVDEARKVGVAGTKTRNEGVSDSRGRATAKALSRLFAWAVEHRRVTVNPTVGMYRPKAPPARDRVLTVAEIREFWRACGELGWPFGPCFQLMLITGQRRSEVAGMRWDELSEDLSVWTLSAARTKNKRLHVVHLPPMARRIIAAAPRIVDSPFVFGTTTRTAISGFSKTKAKLDGLMPSVAAWRTHDLRRTCVTMMAEIGVLPHVIEAVVNHVSGFRSGVAGTYNRASYATERRRALEAWARHLARVVRRR
jgi:integrase